jgi:hypothetical protein
MERLQSRYSVDAGVKAGIDRGRDAPYDVLRVPVERLQQRSRRVGARRFAAALLPVPQCADRYFDEPRNTLAPSGRQECDV